VSRVVTVELIVVNITCKVCCVYCLYRRRHVAVRWCMTLPTEHCRTYMPPWVSCEELKWHSSHFVIKLMIVWMKLFYWRSQFCQMTTILWQQLHKFVTLNTSRLISWFTGQPVALILTTKPTNRETQTHNSKSWLKIKVRWVLTCKAYCCSVTSTCQVWS